MVLLDWDLLVVLLGSFDGTRRLQEAISCLLVWVAFDIVVQGAHR